MDDRTGTEAAALGTDGRNRAAAQRRESVIPAANRLKAIGLMCLAVALFSGLDTSAKYLVTQAHLPTVQIVWARFLGQFLRHAVAAQRLAAVGSVAHAQAEAGIAPLAAHGIDDGLQLPRPASPASRSDRVGGVSRPADRRAAGRAVPRRVGRLAPRSSLSSPASSACSSSCIRASAACTRPSPSPLAACSPTRSSCC